MCKYFGGWVRIQNDPEEVEIGSEETGQNLVWTRARYYSLSGKFNSKNTRERMTSEVVF